MQNFNNIFQEELIKEIPVISVGMFPGKFKPPHNGHFKTAQVATKNNKVVYILISDKEHEGYTAQQALEIWSIYSKYLPGIEPYIVTRTPLIATYELLNILNNGGTFAPTKTTSSPVTNVEDVIANSNILQTYLNKGNNFKANLYSSPEDSERYRNVQKEPYTGKNIVEVSFEPVDRLTSATAFRAALQTRNLGEIMKFIPSELSREDRDSVINILTSNANV